MAVSPANLPKSVQDVVDVRDFTERILSLYEKGTGDLELDVDIYTARSAIPAGTGGIRDFSSIAFTVSSTRPSNIALNSSMS